jgi:hypothetical protein
LVFFQHGGFFIFLFLIKFNFFPPIFVK